MFELLGKTAFWWVKESGSSLLPKVIIGCGNIIMWQKTWWFIDPISFGFLILLK
jgi:hypothetical protein